MNRKLASVTKAKGFALLDGDVEQIKQLEEHEQQLESEVSDAAADLNELVSIFASLKEHHDEVQRRLMQVEVIEVEESIACVDELRDLEAELSLRIAVCTPLDSTSMIGMSTSLTDLFSFVATTTAEDGQSNKLHSNANAATRRPSGEENPKMGWPAARADSASSSSTTDL